MKHYILDEDGFVIASSLLPTSTSIVLEEPPTDCHKWNGVDWVLDEAKVEAKDKIASYSKLDELRSKLSHNETYSYAPNYLETKDILLLEIKTIRDSIGGTHHD